MLIDYLFCLFQEMIILIVEVKVKVNDFNVLNDGKIFFDLSVKNDEEAYEKIIDMSNNSTITIVTIV